MHFETLTIKEKPTDPWVGAFIEIVREPKKKSGQLDSGVCVGIEEDDCNFKFGKKLESFKGSFRIVRIGDQIYTMYRNNSDSKWISIGKYTYNFKDQYVSIGLANYFLSRKKINAPISIKGIFDNFIINAAEELIEEDI